MAPTRVFGHGNACFGNRTERAVFLEATHAIIENGLAVLNGERILERLPPPLGVALTEGVDNLHIVDRIRQRRGHGLILTNGLREEIALQGILVYDLKRPLLNLRSPL